MVGLMSQQMHPDGLLGLINWLLLGGGHWLREEEMTIQKINIRVCGEQQNLV